MTAKRRPRVLVVIGTLEVGGAEMDLVRNLPAIDRERFEVMVYTFTAPGALAPRLEAAGVPVHSGTIRKPGAASKRFRRTIGYRRHASAAQLVFNRALERTRSFASLIRKLMAAILSIAILPGVILSVRVILPMRRLIKGWRISIAQRTRRTDRNRFAFHKWILLVHKWILLDRAAHLYYRALNVYYRALNGAVHFFYRVLNGAVYCYYRILNEIVYYYYRILNGSLHLYYRIYYWALSHVGLSRDYAAVILPMRDFIIDHRIDVVHCILPNAYLYGAIAAALAGRRNIVMSRLSLNHYQKTMPIYYTAERRLLHKLVRIAVGNAQSVLQDLREEGLPERKLFLLYNGIVAQTYEPSPERRQRAREILGVADNAFIMTAVGNLHPYKGHADLIESVARVRIALPEPWRLFIAGSDRHGHEATLRAMIVELGLEDRVILLGHRDDIPDILAASDLHIMPSHEEGLPNSIIEAMASGLPVIASRVGGIPELVIDGENGILVPARAPDTLGEAICALAADEALRREIGRRNIERVHANFSLERSVARYEELYEKLTGVRR